MVKDEEVLQTIYKAQKSVYNDDASSLKWIAIIDIDQNEDIQIKCANEISNLKAEDGLGILKTFW